MVIVSAERGGGIEEIVVSGQWSVDSNGNSNGEYPISNTQYPIMKDRNNSIARLWRQGHQPLTRHFVPPSPEGEG